MRANAAAAGRAAQRTVARMLSGVGDSLPEGELATCYRVPSATADARGRGDICKKCELREGSPSDSDTPSPLSIRATVRWAAPPASAALARTHSAP